MNLIEKLGLEKCKQIVEGAPELTTNYKDGKYYEEWFPGKWTVFDGKHWQDCKKPKRGLICIIDLRTAIDHHYYGQSEEKELEQYAVLSQEKIEGGAMLVGDNSKVVQMVRDITDNCTDIRNHLSPNTTVIDK